RASGRVHEGELNPGGRRPDLRVGRYEITLRQDLLRLADHEVIEQHCRIRMGGAAGDRHAGRQGDDWRQILIAARVCATRAPHLSACALPALLSYSLHEQHFAKVIPTRGAYVAQRFIDDVRGGKAHDLRGKAMINWSSVAASVSTGETPHVCVCVLED